MTDKQAILSLPFHLEDKPSEWFSTLADEAKQSLATIKTAFISRFRPQVSTSINLTKLKQSPTENIEDNIHRAIQYNKYRSASVPFLIELAINGMKSSIAHIIIPQQPQTIEELRGKSHQ